jgi:HK97 family phage major capsid protein
MPLDDTNEIKALIEAQGKAFDAFKSEVDGLKRHDVVTEEKLTRIEKTLDDAVEAKAKIEAALAAERKEREDLELRLSRLGAKGDGGAAEVERKAFCLATGKDMSADDYKSYRDGLALYLRKGEKHLGHAETKAMSVGSDPDGGYLVTPDVTGRMVKKVYESSPIRQIATAISISSDKIEGIEDLDEAGAGWIGETVAPSDTGTPQIGKWTIEAFEMYAMPKTTQKLIEDASVDIEAWISDKVAQRFARLESAAFVSGDGAAKPKGFLSYAVAADDGSGVEWGTLGYVASGASGAFVGSNPADKIFELVGALKPDFLPAAQFVTRRSVITAIRKFKDSTGQYLWQPSLVMGTPEQLAGHPITRAEDMPAIAANSLSLAFGDFGQGYQIVDRLGITVLRDNLTEKPYVKFYTRKRVGGGVVNFEAIKLMKFAAS